MNSLFLVTHLSKCGLPFSISQFNSVDEALSIFIRFLLSSFDSCVPIITPKSGPAWSDRHLKKLKIATSAALKKYTKNRSPVNKCILNEKACLYRTYNRIRYGGYLSRLEKNFIKRPKAPWNFCKKHNNTNVTPKSICHNDRAGSTAHSVMSGAHQNDSSFTEIPVKPFSYY